MSNNDDYNRYPPSSGCAVGTLLMLALRILLAIIIWKVFT